MKISFFRTTKPRQFDYKPVYWDQEKEEADERRKRIQRSGSGATTDDLKSDLRYNINRQWRRGQREKKKGFNTIRFLIYLFMVVFFVYVIFFTDLVSNFLSFFVR